MGDREGQEIVSTAMIPEPVSEPPPPPITVRRSTSYILVSEEVASMAQEFQDLLANALDPNRPTPPPPVDPGPHPGYLRLLADLDIAVDRPPAEVRLLSALLALHSPKWNGGYSTTYHCLGDESNGYDAEPPDWPCETVAVVAKHLGVEL